MTGASVASLIACAALLLAAGESHAQREFRIFPSFEGAEADAPLPPERSCRCWGAFLFCGSFFGRLMVLIAFNNDVADGWQWADDPRYPSEVANLSLQLGVNVAMYALTH